MARVITHKGFGKKAPQIKAEEKKEVKAKASPKGKKKSAKKK